MANLFAAVNLFDTVNLFAMVNLFATANLFTVAKNDIAAANPRLFLFLEFFFVEENLFLHSSEPIAADQ